MFHDGNTNIDKLLDLFDQKEALEEFAVPSSTAVDLQVPTQGDFSENRTNQLANTVGSIRPTPSPLGLDQEQMDEILDIVMSISNPGAGIAGTIKNAPSLIKMMMRGGQKMPGRKSTMDQLLGKSRKLRVSQPSQEKNIIEGINNITKESSAAIEVQKALSKHGDIPIQQGEGVDWITYLLDFFSKN